MNETIPYLPGLSPVENKELCARFDGGRLSSDGGVLLLRGIEKARQDWGGGASYSPLYCGERFGERGLNC